MATPTFIEIPEPPSNPETPSEMPGTPTSTTTSLSALSTTAIKDGHRGSAHFAHQHGHNNPLSSNTLEAERADRISRLAGLERVATVRPGSQLGVASQSGASALPGYFDAQGNPVYYKSTVGSASATGSVGGRTTTWASGSVPGQTEQEDDEDQMSMDTNFRDGDERDRYSTMDQSEDGDGMSEEGNASLVGFGEGAGSTVSGPIYNSNPGRRSLGPGATSASSPFASQQPAVTSASPATSSALEQRRDAKMTSGLAADDTASGL